MKKYSTSPYNTADGRLDKRTLKRFSDPLFGLSKDNLLQSQEIPSDLKEVYKNFVNNTYNNK
ncbi:hypothetical protein KKH82_02355 [Patescibacteria group bacterium]|nr:hypothetical protein [Patescibacteria group bacterium]